MAGSGARLVLAVGASAAVVLSSPFIGRLRDALQNAFPGHYRAIIVAVVVFAAGAALALAAARIRDRLAVRYGALAAAAILAVSYARAIDTGNADVDAAERFHFVEYGLLAVLFYRAWQPRGAAAAGALTVSAALIVAVADEWLQWYVPTRFGDLRDVLLNAVAIVCGLLFAMAVEPPPRGVVVATGGRALRAAASAAVVAVALFVDSVHLGHEIVDADAGTFRSRFRASALDAMAGDRRQQWGTAPPTVAQGIAREDQYLTEGQWHVQRRNEALSEGDASAAWRENLILEKFYAPVLDLQSRWSPEERTRVSALTEGDADYISDAAPYPVFTINRPAFWAVTAVIVAAICASPRRRAATASPMLAA